MHARDLMIFLGAGASASMPTGLPTFDAMRASVLGQLRLQDYVWERNTKHPDKVEVAEQLMPESFMLALSQADVAVEDWVTAVLNRGQPNAAHRAVAQLAGAGARVWTVNFDDNIERSAGGTMRAVAWPDEPSADANADGPVVLKPHGTLGTPLILTSADVLIGLPPAWEERLRADVAGRVIVFLGYRGADLDFRPVWPTLLEHAERVVWFDMPADTAEGGAAQQSKRQLLQRLWEQDRLEFPPPSRRDSEGRSNPSYDFVAWCQGHGLVQDLDPALVEQLFDERPRIDFPLLEGDLLGARAVVQGLLGVTRAQQWSLLKHVVTLPDRKRYARQLANVTANHAGVLVGAGLVVLGRVPGTRMTPIRNEALAKRAALLSKVGRHPQVLAAVERMPHPDATALTIQCEALRFVGTMTRSAEVGRRAVAAAQAERNAVHLAHAAYQLANTYLWAEETDEAARTHAELHDWARVAASRWIAWSDWIEACLAIRTGRIEAADEALGRARDRFTAEGLTDGRVSVDTVRLTWKRVAGDLTGFQETARDLHDLIRRGSGRGRFYARGHAFSLEAVEFELAEFERCHADAPQEAQRRYQLLTHSQYPLHQGLGQLGLGLLDAGTSQGKAALQRADEIGQHIGCRLFGNYAALDVGATDLSTRDIVFC